MDRKKMKESYTVVPIGYVRQSDDGFYLEIKQPYNAALKHLDKFSHVKVFWWAHKNDNKNARNIFQVVPPYSNKKAGIFTMRAEYRPNPICETICQILHVDEKKGIVIVPYMDAFPGTPILDLKTYLPLCDRIRDVHIAPWLKDWPEWYEEAAEWWAENFGDFEEGDEPQTSASTPEQSPKIPKSGRLGRLAKIIVNKTSQAVLDNIMHDWDSKRNPAAKAAWVHTVLERLKNKIGTEKTLEIMDACGEACYNNMKFLQKVGKELQGNSHSIEEFVAYLNTRFGNSSKFELKDENTIIGEHFKCYCSLVKNAKAPSNKIMYCQCAAGARQKFFEVALSKASWAKSVNVEILESVITGGKSCRYSIKF